MYTSSTTDTNWAHAAPSWSSQFIHQTMRKDWHTNVSTDSSSHNNEQSLSADTTLRAIDQVVNMDVDTPIQTKDETICLVLDTNVLLGYLDVIEQFTDDIDSYNLPVEIRIPGIVVQELDSQKERYDPALRWASRRASTWILTKVRERKSLKGQAHHQTCQTSGKWLIRDKGLNNDDLILDCCLFFHGSLKNRVFAISADHNLCSKIEFQDIPTINPRHIAKWSSREIATKLFGEHFPGLRRFAGYRPTYRPSKVREALDAELGQQPAAPSGHNDDGMEVDDDASDGEPLPSHKMDQLHIEIIAHFTALLIDLVKRVAPQLFNQAQKRAGAAASIHSPYSGCQEWTARECVEYLGNTGSQTFSRAASNPSVLVIKNGSARLADFLTKVYKHGARRGQDWPKADWLDCLRVLWVLGDVWRDEQIIISLKTVETQFDYVFRTPMRPTGN